MARGLLLRDGMDERARLIDLCDALAPELERLETLAELLGAGAPERLGGLALLLDDVVRRVRRALNAASRPPSAGGSARSPSPAGGRRGRRAAPG